jgi:hypothetical protein
MNCRTCGEYDSVLFGGDCIQCAKDRQPVQKNWQAMYESCAKCLATKSSQHSRLIERLDDYEKRMCGYAVDRRDELRQIIDEARGA